MSLLLLCVKVSSYLTHQIVQLLSLPAPFITLISKTLSPVGFTIVPSLPVTTSVETCNMGLPAPHATSSLITSKMATSQPTLTNPCSYVEMNFFLYLILLQYIS